MCCTLDNNRRRKVYASICWGLLSIGTFQVNRNQMTILGMLLNQQCHKAEGETLSYNSSWRNKSKTSLLNVLPEACFKWTITPEYSQQPFLCHWVRYCEVPYFHGIQWCSKSFLTQIFWCQIVFDIEHFVPTLAGKQIQNWKLASVRPTTVKKWKKNYKCHKHCNHKSSSFNLNIMQLQCTVWQNQYELNAITTDVQHVIWYSINQYLNMPQ